jgi:chromosome partitioning protein
MAVLSIINRKGGCGKSTLATALAGTFASGGVPTAIVDLDPQGSATAWGACRPAERPAVRVARSKPGILGDDLKRLAAEGVMMTIIDPPPHNDAALAGALSAADAILMPSLASAFDLHSLASLLDGVTKAGKPIGVVLTATTPGTLGLKEAVSAVGAMGLPLIGMTGRRMAWQYAAARGFSPTEMDPKGEAANEVRTLCEAVIRLLEGGR